MLININKSPKHFIIFYKIMSFTANPLINYNSLGKDMQIVYPAINNISSEPLHSKITIYSSSGHIVQRYNYNTKTITLPKSVEVNSLVVIDSNSNVIPFSYISETNLGTALTNRSTGEKVFVTVIKGSQKMDGRVISLDGDSVTITTGNQIINTREYDQIIVNIPENQDYTRPRIVIDNKESINYDFFTISYLLSSISWNCVGTALIDDGKSKLYLRLAGNIINNTETDISGNTILVSGEVYQNRPNTPRYNNEAVRSMAVYQSNSAPISSKKANSSMLEDYVKYEVGDRIIHNKDLAELGTLSLSIIKLYIHRTDERNIVKFGYRFTAPGFIPSCSINAYSILNDNTIDAYLGSNEINESQKDDEVDLIIGESTMLQCKSNIISNDIVISNDDATNQYNLHVPLDNSNNNSRQWHILTENISVNINNHNNKESNLVLKHYVGKKRIINITCTKYNKREDGFIEWYFTIPSGSQKQEFSCEISTASYY